MRTSKKVFSGKGSFFRCGQPNGFDRVRVLLVAGLLLVSASDLVEAASYTRYTGNSQAGAKLVSEGTVQQSSTLVRAHARVTGYARLFGRTYEAVAAVGESKVEDGVSSNVVTVKVAGYSVYNIDRSYGWSWNWTHSQSYFEKNRTIWVAGVPINCGIEVGGTLYANLSLGVAVVGAGLQGKFGSNTWGTATAGVDLLIYRAGVRSEVVLFDNWLEPSLTVGVNGIAGKLDYVSDPIKIFVKIVLDQAKWKRKGWKWRRVWEEIASYTLTSWEQKYASRYTILSF